MGPGLPFNHGDHAHRDVRYGLANGGRHVEEGLTFRAEAQPGLWGWDNVRLAAARPTEHTSTAPRTPHCSARYTTS